MVGSELVRRISFWGTDLIKGSPIRQHIRDLERSFADPIRGHLLAEERLGSILTHACATAAFYKKFAREKKLSGFPVIQKKIIKDNYNDFLSCEYQKNDLVKTTTSGSYGTPFTFYLTKEKRARQFAEVIFFSGWAGYKVGMPYAQVRVHSKPWWYLFLQNGVLIDPSAIDNNWLEKYRKLLREGSIHFIIGYPTAINPIANYCKTKGDGPADFKLKGIISGAENLLESVRKTWESVFGCTVLDRYSSNELGLIAHECAKYRGYHLNFISNKVELLKFENDEPVAPGEVGRVIVTDFFSHAMPLIRYDTGDIAVWAKGNCPCRLNVPVLERIEGRLIETIYTPSGIMINALAVDRDPKDLPGIIQFQFIQKNRDTYVVRLHVTEAFKDEAVLHHRYQKLLGDDAIITFEYVDSIPPLASGKRPYIINEYKKPQPR